MKTQLYKILCRILGFFTKIFLYRTQPIVIGVTGSVGKTTCREIIAQVFTQVQDVKKVYSSPKNYNSELGLIFSVFCIEQYTPGIKNLFRLTGKIVYESLFARKKYDILVAEYGIDSPGDMDFLLSVIQPDIGIITKLDTVHSQNFPGGVEEYWQDKTKLLLASKIKTYFPGNDDFLQKQSTLFGKNTSEIFTQKISINFEKDNKTIIQKLKYKEKEISINLVGEENIEYTKLALDILGYLDFGLSQECYSFNFILHSGRFNILDYGERVYIDSTYNASPESMKKVIKNTQTLKKEMYPDFEHIYVLGDMRELGDSSQEAHKSLAFHILRSKAIFTIGPEMYSSLVPELHHQNYSGEIHSSLSALEIGKNLKKYTTKNKESKYIILFKGSQNTIFTEESLALQLPASQRKNLVRQTQDWKQKKDIFFKSI